jgi:hypothetical protein
VSISPKAPVRFSTGWCTVDEKTLDENLLSMEYVFTVDGDSVLEQAKMRRYTEKDEKNPNVDIYCETVGGVISEWIAGRTYNIVFGFKITKEINDGWDVYPPGDHLYLYTITADPNVTTIPAP